MSPLQEPGEIQPTPDTSSPETESIRLEEAAEPKATLTPPAQAEEPAEAQPTLVTHLPETGPVPLEQTVNCPNCGSKNSATYRFCGTCGMKLGAEVQPAPATPLPETRTVPLEEVTKTEVPQPQPVKAEKPAEIQTTPVTPFTDTVSARLEVVKPKVVPTPPVAGGTIPGDKPTFEAWQDARMTNLVDALVSGRLTKINPVIDTSVQGGFTYPEADKILETSGEETINVLEALAKDNILDKKPFEKLHVDPEGSLQLVPVERCPHCDSGNLIRGQLIEHFACGNVGLDHDFQADHKYICPKCNRELKLLGTDYHNVGIQHKCLDCKELFPMPVVKWRSLKTGKIWAVEELQEVWLYSYSLRPDKKNWLEFQLKPKAQLIDFLRLRGYQVEELPEIKGASGAVHTIDILATRDDVLAKFYVGIGILTPMSGEKEIRLEELFKFDTRAYDMGINHEVVIAIPKLSPEAIKFAERQKIGVFEASGPEALVSFLSSRSRPSPAVLTRAKTPHLSEISTELGPQAQLVEFLRRRGYEVFEKLKINGKSGAEHTFNIFAQRDDVIVRPTIAVAVVTAGERPTVGIGKVSQFDVKAYDVGVLNKVFVGIPKVSPQAKQFAKQQRIKILEGYELEGLIRSSAAI